MTEDINEYEWLNSPWVWPLWLFVRERVSEAEDWLFRKNWLFACAICRHLPGSLESRHDRLVLEAAEGYIEGEDRLEEMIDHTYETKKDIRFHRLDAGQAVARALEAIWIQYEYDERAWSKYAEILRDIFGNPFRQTKIDPAWRTSEVVSLAQKIYDERVFELMPALANALGSAGCRDADILRHCRQPGTHVRGCWLIDLILEKTIPQHTWEQILKVLSWPEEGPEKVSGTDP
jgi:hypothetical protein